MKKYHSLSALFLSLSLVLSLASAAHAAEPEEPFTVSAASAILVEAGTGEVLFELDPDARRYPASITKVMTGLLTVEAVERGDLTMDTVVTLGGDIYTGIGESASTANMQEGEILTVRDLLNCALIPSANEACNALAVVVAGNIPAFVERMNQRAAELGMENTHFVNTHGYHDDAHYTSARDVSIMCMEAMKHPDFRQIVSSVSYVVPETNLHAKRELHDTNALVSNFRTGESRLLYRYAVGIKTGSTPEAGYCLASAAEKNGRTMIAVLLGGENWRVSGQFNEPNYFSESKRLLEHGFNDFSRKEILSGIDPIATIPVSLCAEQDYVTVQPASSLEASLHNDLDPALFTRAVDLPEALEAPIEKGQVLGTISVSYDGRDYGTVDLVSTTGLERSELLYILDQAQRFFGQLWVKLAALALVLFLLVLVLRQLLRGGRRTRRRGGPSKTYSGSYRGRRR